MPTRRDLLKLSLFLMMGCMKSSSESDGRLGARVQSDRAQGSATPRPQRLGLGKQRDGLFYAPVRQELAPLIVFLHGAGGSAEWAMEPLVAHANRTGTIIVAPDSRSRTWGMISGDEAADVAFIDSALRRMFESYSIDPRRIGISGFSDGASAALSWGLVNGDLFSGIAAFSPGFLKLSSAPMGEPRIFISHGTDDEILPIDRCGRRIARLLREARYTVEYREFEGGHTVPPETGDDGLRWIFA